MAFTKPIMQTKIKSALAKEPIAEADIAIATVKETAISSQTMFEI